MPPSSATNTPADDPLSANTIGPEPATPRSTRPGFLYAFSALKHRNYRLYWFGQLISLIGTWMQATGIAWLVLQVTHSAWQLGVVSALQYLPVLLFALLGGVFADRWPKRELLLVTQAVAMVQAIIFYALVITHTIQLWEIALLAFLLGITTSLDQPTRQAFVVEMVGREELPNAIALNSSMGSLVRILGPALGGLIISLGGVDPLFLLNAMSFIAALSGLALIDRRALHYPDHPADTPLQSMWQSLREGIMYSWQSPAILLIIWVAGLVLLWGANFTVILPVFATDVLHVGANGFGALSSALGVGALLGGIWLAWRQPRMTIHAFLLSLFLFGALDFSFALSLNVYLSAILIASISAVEAIYAAQSITVLQAMTPDRLRGRVMSVAIFFFTGSAPLGFLLAGWLTALCGASLGLLICAMLIFLTVAVGWIWRDRAEHDLAAHMV